MPRLASCFWKFDSGIKGTQPDRGLAYWTDGKDKRILVGVMNFVYALDAVTGQPIATLETRAGSTCGKISAASPSLRSRFT